MTYNRINQTCTTEEMAKILGLCTKTLLRLRRDPVTPFRLGEHYRYRGTTRNAPLQWFPEATDHAFTSFQAERWRSIETMEGVR